MQIVSVPGRLVRDPETLRVVDDEPLTIDPTLPHWHRLLADGDVRPAETAEPTPAPTPAAEGNEA